MPGLGYFCKVQSEYRDSPCRHKSCNSDPAVRASDDTLIAFATTCSDRGIALTAEIALRKRYPSRRWKRPKSSKK